MGVGQGKLINQLIWFPFLTSKNRIKPWSTVHCEVSDCLHWIDCLTSYINQHIMNVQDHRHTRGVTRKPTLHTLPPFYPYRNMLIQALPSQIHRVCTHDACNAPSWCIEAVVINMEFTTISGIYNPIRSFLLQRLSMFCLLKLLRKSDSVHKIKAEQRR